MNSRILTIILAVGVVITSIALVPKVKAYRVPGNNIGFEPVQPINFSHRLHAGDLQVPCLYCHYAAEKSRHAGIPAASVCMNCHRVIPAARATVRAEEELAKKEKRQPRRIVSPEIRKIYRALALDDNAQPVSGMRMQPVAWVRIDKLPDFVYFDHRVHVARGLACQQCHGPVETMERVRQQETLSMGFCVNCHRGRTVALIANKPSNGPTDCSACHY